MAERLDEREAVVTDARFSIDAASATVLLLGTTGKAGAPIDQELLDRGRHVTAVVRDSTRLPPEGPSLHHRADVVVCSVASRDAAQSDRTPVALMRGNP
jgi:nucleoside-diphosphate-sugar epimerase